MRKDVRIGAAFLLDKEPEACETPSMPDSQKKKLKFRIVRECLLALVLSAGSSMAEDIYVSQMQQGGGWGTNSACAKSVAWFNAAANWGSGANKISVGDTVHLVGTITNSLTVLMSGAPGSPITILFEPNASIAMPAVPATGAINCQKRSYLTIDGGVNGVIRSTDNGTARGNQVNSIGVDWEGSGGLIAGLTIQNLTITNLYVRTANSSDVNGSGKGVYVTGALTNSVVRNCAISWCASGILIAYSPGRSLDIECYSNSVSHCNQAITVGDADRNAVVDGLAVHDNRINLFDDWEDPGAYFHHDGIFVFAANPGSFMTNLSVFNNVIGPYFGTHITAAIYTVSTPANGIRNAAIYNNVLFTATNKAPSCGFIDAGYVQGGCICNNTLDANGYGGIGVMVSNGTNIMIVNNAMTGINYPIYVGVAGWIEICDYNGYYYGGKAVSAYYGGAIISYAKWGMLGFDKHSVVAYPAYTGGAAFDFRLQSSSPFINAGLNLSPLCTSDILGVTRPRGLAWDLGAYE